MRRSGGELVEKALDHDAVLDGGTLAGLGAVELDEFGPLESEAVHAKPNADAVKVAGERAVVAQLADFAERP